MRITLTDAGKRFNREWIFRHLNYQFSPSDSYAITGPNGFGVVLVAGGGMEDAGIRVESRRHEGADPGRERADGLGNPRACGDVVLDGAAGELHGRNLPRETDNPRAAPRRRPRESSCTRADWTNVGGPGVG